MNVCSTDGSYSVLTFDEFADRLLTEERVCDTQLPRLTQRKVLEETEGLPKRRSKLAKAMDLEFQDGENSADERRARRRNSGSSAASNSDRYVSRSPSASGSASSASDSRQRRRESKEMSVDGEEDRYISRSPSPERYISRSPSPA